ncbi:hypothetical protein EDD85DRAFT_806732 [Armillaria nabsnona]|nr:hypothetical protein EDD85DRAFT_806732 [Armillaria nabsnona]
MLPLSLSNAAQNKPMLVKLKNSETFNRHLINCNNFMHITLKEKLKECYIWGSTIKYICISENLLDVAGRSNSRGGHVGGRGRRGVPVRGHGRGAPMCGGRGRGRGM